MSTDPTDLRSIVVTTGDVVAALELNRTGDDHATLRITPPFSGRMRARLHVDRTGEQAGRADAPEGPDVSGPSHHGPQTGDENSGLDGEMRDRERADHTGAHPLYVDPEQLVADPPAYPRPTDTRAELLDDPETAYTVERHHEHHATAVEQWRESVTGCICEQITLETPDGARQVTVRTLQDDLF